MSRMKNRPIFWPPRTVLDLRLMDRGLPPRFPLERWKLSRELDLFIFQFKKQRCVDCLPTVETCWYVMSSSDVVYARMALTKAVQSLQVLAEAKATKVEAKANKVEVKMEAFMLGKCWPVLFISLNACYLGIMGITQTTPFLQSRPSNATLANTILATSGGFSCPNCLFPPVFVSVCSLFQKLCICVFRPSLREVDKHYNIVNIHPSGNTI